MADITINDLASNEDLKISWEVTDGFVEYGVNYTIIAWSEIEQLVFDNCTQDLEDDPNDGDILSFVQSDEGADTFDEVGFNNKLNELIKEYIQEDFDNTISFCNIAKEGS